MVAVKIGFFPAALSEKGLLSAPAILLLGENTSDSWCSASRFGKYVKYGANLLKTAQKAMTLHIFGVQVLLLPGVRCFPSCNEP